MDGQCATGRYYLSSRIRLFSFGWTSYGGNGQTNFALPNLQDSTVLHMGPGLGLTQRVLGEIGGAPSVTFLESEMPAHTHTKCSRQFWRRNPLPGPVNNVWAGPGADRDLFWYHPTPTGVTMAPNALSISGGSQPHNNYMPYLGLNFCIAIQGIFPSRN